MKHNCIGLTLFFNLNFSSELLQLELTVDELFLTLSFNPVPAQQKLYQYTLI